MNDKSLHSSLKRAKNLGASGHAVLHWWYQRFSAMLLALLTIWLVYIALKIKDSPQQQIHNLLHTPLHFSCLALFIISAFYHATIGMQVIIEDYISHIGKRFALIIILKIFSIVTVIAALTALCFFVFL